MSNEEDNKAIVRSCFTHFWGETCNLDIVDAAPTCCSVLVAEPRRGHRDIRAFMADFREALLALL